MNNKHTVQSKRESSDNKSYISTSGSDIGTRTMSCPVKLWMEVSDNENCRQDSDPFLYYVLEMQYHLVFVCIRLHL